jgi:hypothetical protein
VRIKASMAVVIGHVIRWKGHEALDPMVIGATIKKIVGRKPFDP